MTPDEFAHKWTASTLGERQAYQAHFHDLCTLLNEPVPYESDPTGAHYCFEKGATKTAGGKGVADVWKRNHFAIEYKGKRADLGPALSSSSSM